MAGEQEISVGKPSGAVCTFCLVTHRACMSRDWHDFVVTGSSAGEDWVEASPRLVSIA